MIMFFAKIFTLFAFTFFHIFLWNIRGLFDKCWCLRIFIVLFFLFDFMIFIILIIVFLHLFWKTIEFPRCIFKWCSYLWNKTTADSPVLRIFPLRLRFFAGWCTLAGLFPLFLSLLRDEIRILSFSYFY